MTFTRSELDEAFSTWHNTVTECVRTHDWAPFVELFTEDVEYHESIAGILRGHEQVLGWVTYAMATFPGTEFVELPVHWHVIDEQNARIVAKMGNVMSDPGDGSRLETTNLAVLQYAGNGRFSSQEDVYDRSVFLNQVKEWGQRAMVSGSLTDEQRGFFESMPPG